ncbi:periphilin-1 [Synchiropus picturatus]
MTYRRDRNLRNMYEERFPDRGGHYPRGSQERRFPFGRQEDYNHGAGYDAGPRFFTDGGDQRNYYADEQRGYHGDSHHFPLDRRGAPPPPRREDYPYRGPREDPHGGRPMDFGRAPPPSHSLRNYTASRLAPESEENLMPAIFTAGGGRKPGPASSYRERSPCRRDGVRSPHSRSGSSVSSRGYSPDRAKAASLPVQPNKIPGLSRESSPLSSVSVKEENQPTPEKEEQTSANAEESQKPAEAFDCQRAAAIAAKAKEIEEIFQKDCEVFGMVVNMLVVKDPNLETQLQVPLRESLGEIRERCLNELKRFIAELDRAPWPSEGPLCDAFTAQISC